MDLFQYTGIELPNTLRRLPNRSHWKHEQPNYKMHRRAKARARVNKLEFAIDPTDIDIPTHCPIFGFPLIVNEGVSGYNSPTLDRIDNSKGYIKSNIWVISQLANSMKSSADRSQMVYFAMWVLNTVFPPIKY